MNPNCSELINLSIETWERIAFARTRFGLKIFETTITQNLIYNLTKNKTKNGIILFEAIDEATNGNDIEIFVKTKGGYLFLPTQAKIIYNQRNNYPKMEHGNQINDLIAYANLYSGIPFYLLYNYYPNSEYAFTQNICGVKCKKEYLGCTLVSATYLLDNFAFKAKITKGKRKGSPKWIIPKFVDLHNNNINSIAKPWFILSCCGSHLTAKDLVRKLTPSTTYENLNWDKIHEIQEEDFFYDQAWKEIEIESLESVDISKREYQYFKPKFRIVINAEKK